ncbi:MAG: NFACT RNA binding domain-containing protein [Candidatus Micrarchaeaceae archaeon]
MKIEIDYTRSAQDNADQYFKLSKKLKKKAEGAAIAIRNLELKRKEISSIQPKQVKIKKITEKKWYEKFNWFTTSSKELVIGGKSALQNELINSRHFESNDLFFHADVFGASAVILKDGVNASREIREEVAQFAVCFSKAWENGMAAANAYSLRRDQVSKSREKGSLGTGSFLLQGEREWFKGVSLELCAYAEDGQSTICIAPMSTCIALGIKRYLLLKPGNIKKSDAAKAVAKKLNFDDIDYVMQHLPPGSFSIKDI